jgi:hypothetical protein
MHGITHKMSKEEIKSQVLCENYFLHAVHARLLLFPIEQVLRPDIFVNSLAYNKSIFLRRNRQRSSIDESKSIWKFK